MKKKLVKILSLDGGGVRGVIPLSILNELEERTGKRTAEMFDMIAGNSTGGIITLLLNIPDEAGNPKYSAQEVVKLYEDLGPKGFVKSRFQRYFNIGGLFTEKYESEGNLSMATRIFGTTRIKDAVAEILVASYELESSKPFFFKRWAAKKDEAMNFKFADAAGATIAAPTYFKPYIVEMTADPLIKHYGFIDGGVVANNPAMCAYVEAKAIFPDAEDYMVVSLGTGAYTAEFLLENVRYWGGASWIKPLLQIFLNGQSEIVDHQLRILHETSGDQLKHYFRLQVRLNESELPFDDFSNKKLHLLEILGQDTIKRFSKQLDEISKLL